MIFNVESFSLKPSFANASKNPCFAFANVSSCNKSKKPTIGTEDFLSVGLLHENRKISSISLVIFFIPFIKFDYQLPLAPPPPNPPPPNPPKPPPPPPPSPPPPPKNPPKPPPPELKLFQLPDERFVDAASNAQAAQN